LNNFTLPLPPIDEQLQIVQNLRNVEKLLEQKKKYLNKANELFNSLSQKAFAGEL
jgi:restriction endonuclease S subunit